MRNVNVEDLTAQETAALLQLLLNHLRLGIVTEDREALPYKARLLKLVEPHADDEPPLPCRHCGRVYHHASDCPNNLDRTVSA